MELKTLDFLFWMAFFGMACTNIHTLLLVSRNIPTWHRVKFWVVLLGVIESLSFDRAIRILMKTQTLHNNMPGFTVLFGFSIYLNYYLRTNYFKNDYIASEGQGFEDGKYSDAEAFLVALEKADGFLHIRNMHIFAINYGDGRNVRAKIRVHMVGDERMMFHFHRYNKLIEVVPPNRYRSNGREQTQTFTVPEGTTHDFEAKKGTEVFMTYLFPEKKWTTTKPLTT